ncbi:hypothetical protein O181_069742 [Austropuccinia psidii MF-1]|uniref:Uncharacterized protein n=1 Tax=Austropuccinia psidii MF-1 TaxID=1389203 RepID=A0A9Q3F4Q7_9BASI|nr:hypothetical protein [Austropuccinia psidii MF-1]
MDVLGHLGPELPNEGVQAKSPESDERHPGAKEYGSDPKDLSDRIWPDRPYTEAGKKLAIRIGYGSGAKENKYGSNGNKRDNMANGP